MSRGVYNTMKYNTITIQLNLSPTATLRKEKGGHCRELEKRVNLWTVR